MTDDNRSTDEDKEYGLVDFAKEYEGENPPAMEWTCDELDVTPNEELRELVEEWRDTDNILEANEPKQYGREKCADELESVLEEHK